MAQNLPVTIEQQRSSRQWFFEKKRRGKEDFQQP
jgi:hypothetical protein